MMAWILVCLWFNNACVAIPQAQYTDLASCERVQKVLYYPNAARCVEVKVVR